MITCVFILYFLNIDMYVFYFARDLSRLIDLSALIHLYNNFIFMFTCRNVLAAKIIYIYMYIYIYIYI